MKLFGLTINYSKFCKTIQHAKIFEYKLFKIIFVKNK